MEKPTQPLEVKGERLYQTRLRRLLEKDHHGKYVAIEVESRDYSFIGETLGDVRGSVGRGGAQAPGQALLRRSGGVARGGDV